MSLRKFITATVLSLCFLGQSFAIDLVSNGNSYLDIGLQLGADTLLVFPEPVERSPENDEAFEVAESETDPRIISIRPTKLHEQRVTFIGTKSKSVYLARFSTRSAYSPIYRIRDGAAIESARAAASNKLTPTSFMKVLMAGNITNGVATRKQKQDLVEGPEYKIVAYEVWETPTITGIVATAYLQPGTDSTTIRPSDISLKVPVLGNLRMMGADRWDLDKDVPVTTVYFVFTK